jgi:hypothetical protein
MRDPRRRAVDGLTALVLLALAVSCISFGVDKARGILSLWGSEAARELREGDPESYFWLLAAGIPLLGGTVLIGLGAWLFWRAVRNTPIERL